MEIKMKLRYRAHKRGILYHILHRGKHKHER
jgi:hypothetical protein